jgi:hypothetical protein
MYTRPDQAMKKACPSTEIAERRTGLLGLGRSCLLHLSELEFNDDSEDRGISREVTAAMQV